MSSNHSMIHFISFWIVSTVNIILVRLQDNSGDKWSTVSRATQSVVEGTLANVPDFKRVGCEILQNERSAVRATEEKKLLLQGSACQPSPLSMPETIFQASMVPRPPARIKATTFKKTMPRSSNIIDFQSNKIAAVMISKKISKFLLDFLFWWHLSTVWSYRAWSSATEMHSNVHAYKQKRASWIEYPKSNATIAYNCYNTMLKHTTYCRHTDMLCSFDLALFRTLVGCRCGQAMERAQWPLVQLGSIWGVE